MNTEPDDLRAVFAVRHTVFVAGQGVPPEIERDGFDAEAIHMLAETDGTTVGTGRLVVRGDVGVVGRMAVLSSARGAGIGTAILAALEQHAVAAGLAGTELHAQLPARRFYERAGYVAIGSAYLEAGLEHITMRKPLPVIRPVADLDSPALIELIEACWAPYPGCVLDVDAEEPWLRAPATAYAGLQGAMWVATLDGEVVACVGLKPHGKQAELKSLYVAPAARRRGLGGQLIRLVEDAARRLGHRRMELWSDTRFTDAHRLYERLGYRRLPDIRELHDQSQSIEYHYLKGLDGSILQTGESRSPAGAPT